MTAQTNFHRPKRSPSPYETYHDPLWERALYGVIGMTAVIALWAFILLAAVQLINQGV